MALPATDHGAVRLDLDAAHGPFPSLLDRLAAGEQALPGGGPLWVSGRYFNAQIVAGATSTAAPTANRLYLVPIFAAKARAINQIASAVSTSATGNVRMGVYNSDPVTGYPTTLLVGGSAAVSTATTGDKTHTVTATLNGVHWLAFTASAGTFSTMAAATMVPVAGGSGPAAALPNYLHPTATADPAVALPATLVGSTWNYVNGAVPFISLRAA